MLEKVPTVQLARRHPDLVTPFMGTDDRQSMTELIKKMLKVGHRRIAYLGSLPGFSPGLDRLAAFRDRRDPRH